MESLQTNGDDQISKARREREAEIAKQFPMAGSLGLPALLDEKRCRYGIPLSAFAVEPIFDMVLIWQVPLEDSKTYGGTLIEKTDSVLKRELTEAPRGVIVGAGLQALDQLRSYGVDIGHTVVFTHLAPFRLRLPLIAGKESVLVIVQSRLIFGSEELAQNLKTRKCRRLMRDNEHGIAEHFFCDENGKIWKPSEVETEQS